MSVSREELAERLRDRRVEIEQTLFVRTSSVSPTQSSEDPEYLEGFRAAHSSALEYGIAVIELGEGGDLPPIPAEILTQARLAARHSVGLDVVLRRYVAGSGRLDDFILEECDADSAQRLLRSRARALEHLLAKVSDEYGAEHQKLSRSRDSKALGIVLKLLRGEPISSAALNYDLALNHVALVVRGSEIVEKMGKLSKELDSRLLLIRTDPETRWVWLGRRGSIHPESVQRILRELDLSGIAGIGEPAQGAGGWCLTHRQAKAAFNTARVSTTAAARYADVCLLASASQDDLLATSLQQLYLRPLQVGPDRGTAYLHTLRAYFACQQNGAATASTLGLSRQAVANRLRAIENRLGQPLVSCSPAIQIALQLEGLSQMADGPDQRTA